MQHRPKLVISAVSTRPSGAMTILRGLLASLDADRFDIVLLYANKTVGKVLRDDLPANSNITLQHVPIRGGGLGVFVWQFARLRTLVRQLEADLVLGINHHIPRLPCAQIIYHMNVLRFQGPWLRALFQKRLADAIRDLLAHRSLRLAHANVFESRYLLDYAKTIRPDIKAARIIYIGLPDERIDEVECPQNVTSKASTALLAVTSARPHKDNGTLINCLHKITQRHPEQDWHLHIAGGIADKDWDIYRKQARQLGIFDKITWHGFCDDQQLKALYRQSLCLVTTSRVESFCMVALEAMIHSCPCVVANTSSMPESVGDAALLAAPADADDFADKVISLWKSSDFRQQMVARGCAHIEKYRWSQCGADFMELFDELMDQQEKATTGRRGTAS